MLEINHYYPYGLQLFGIDNEGRSYPYKYGSKELQQDEWARRMVLGGDFINLDWLDFEARMYDPTVARWYNPDPAEQFMNPYLAMGNSPTMYVDPDGEFVHIIVGAAIGGIGNWIANGAQFNAKGLAAVGLGLAAGGLAAGIGAGVGAAIAGKASAGGGFAAGFAGSSTISSTGFVAGAAMGGSAGATNGLITGTGNMLLNGATIGTAVVDGGLKQAAIQGVSGAAIMGTVMGINSSSKGGGFFESGCVDKEIIKKNVINLSQDKKENCLACIAEAMTREEGLGISEESIRETLGGNPNTTPLTTDKFGMEFAYRTGTHYQRLESGTFTKAGIFGYMKTHKYAALNRHGIPSKHALALKKGVMKTFNFSNSPKTINYHYRVMDPKFGKTVKLNWSLFKYDILLWD